MNIKGRSFFRDEAADFSYFEKWVKKLERTNNRSYERIEVETSLGKTHVWGLNTAESHFETLVIFPGARTTSLFWDLDKGLDNLKQKLRIFLVETNGLPNLSNGAAPDIKTLEYGIWANEVLMQLKINRAFIAGASFGGLICMKLGIVNPAIVKAAFILNPGCLQPFSLRLRNLYYNILPLVRPTEENILKFVNKAIFSKPTHRLSQYAEKMLIDYELFAITRYKDKTDKPYYMNKQLEMVKVDTYLLLGDKDLLFPYQQSVANATRLLSQLKDIKVFEDVGHGIETYEKAMNYIGKKIESLR